MEMKLAIDRSIQLSLETLNKCILLGPNRQLLMITHHKTRSIERTNFFGKKSHGLYLIELDLWTYFPKHDKWFTVGEEACKHLIKFYDLHKLREDYVNIRKGIEALGYKIVKDGTNNTTEERSHS